jgi:hypothetical protein
MGKKSKPQAKLMKKRKSAMLPEVCLISRLSVRVFGALCVCVCVCVFVCVNRRSSIFAMLH